MLTPDHLDQAVRAGIISGKQRDALMQTVSTEPPELAACSDSMGGTIVHDQAMMPDNRDENIRLIGGGNDLFVTIGIILVGAGLFFGLSTFFPNQTVILFGLLAGCAWVLAEFVTRQRRMRLSSTLLALFFVVTSGTMIGQAVWQSYDFANIQTPVQALLKRPVIGWASLIGFSSLIAVSVLYFWRFRVPVLAGVVAVALTALAFIFTSLYLFDGVTTGAMPMPSSQDVPDVLRDALYMPLMCGLLVFGCAVALDIHDKERVTIWSDCAFWLHVVSAPLLVHPLFIMATGQDVVVGEIEPGADASILLTLLIVAFVYIALAIDRRSLLVPTLAYFGTLSIYTLVNNAADSTGIPAFAIILLVIGTLIMVFGAGWQKIRNLIISPTLPTSILQRLPPIKA